MTAKDFIEALPEKLRQEGTLAEDTRFHFDISGDGGGQYTLNIENGEVDLSEGLKGEAKCVVKAKGDSLVKIIKGELNPMMAVMTGKIKISNLGEMMKYASLFSL
jgi:putative sterol carrier protein